MTKIYLKVEDNRFLVSVSEHSMELGEDLQVVTTVCITPIGLKNHLEVSKRMFGSAVLGPNGEYKPYEAIKIAANRAWDLPYLRVKVHPDFPKKFMDALRLRLWKIDQAGKVVEETGVSEATPVTTPGSVNQSDKEVAQINPVG